MTIDNCDTCQQAPRRGAQKYIVLTIYWIQYNILFGQDIAIQLNIAIQYIVVSPDQYIVRPCREDQYIVLPSGTRPIYYFTTGQRIILSTLTDFPCGQAKLGK
jgi:hypothetical protein